MTAKSAMVRECGPANIAIQMCDVKSVTRLEQKIAMIAWVSATTIAIAATVLVLKMMMSVAETGN